MKKILLGLAVAGCALALSVQAGEKNGKTSCCASTHAKAGTCSAKTMAAGGKSACCGAAHASVKNLSPFPVKGGVLLMKLARK